MADLEIKIRGDTTGLKEIEAGSRKAFSPANMREYKREGKELSRDHANLNRRIIEVTRSMRGLEKGTQAFKDMRKELKGIQKDAGLVKTAMEAIERITSKPGRPGAGAFVAGVGQGAGLAQYIPTGPGQAGRMIGAGVGGMLRRGAGAAAAPFITPGIGGISQALSGIPLVGGALAGALEQAGGMYREAVGYDRAALGALPYAGAPPSAARQRAARARQLREATERVETEFQPQLAAARAKHLAALQAAAGAGGIELTGGAVARKAAGARERAPAFVRPFMAETERERERRTTRDISSGALRRSAEELAKVGQRRDMALKAAQKSARGLSVTGLPGLSEGVGFGMGPQQMIQSFSEMMQARGGTYDDVRRQSFRSALAAKTMFGVSAGQAGQFLRMGTEGGGGQGALNLATVLQSATEQGLKGSQVVEYLSRLVDLGNQAEQTGVKIDPRAFIKASATMRGLGTMKQQAGRVAGGLQRAAGGLAARGVSSPMDILMLRHAGWSPEQGPEGLALAYERLEEGGLDVGGLIGDIVSGAGGGVGGPGLKALQIKRAMGKLQIPVSMKQARTWARGVEGGELKPEVLKDIQRMITAGERPGAEQRMIAGAKELVARDAPTARGAAGLEAERIGIGRGAAGYMVGMERNAIRTGKIMNNFGKNLNQLNAIVAILLRNADKITQGGVGGVMSQIAPLIQTVFGIPIAGGSK
jgi:hypothetical protein